MCSDEKLKFANENPSKTYIFTKARFHLSVVLAFITIVGAIFLAFYGVKLQAATNCEHLIQHDTEIKEVKADVEELKKIKSFTKTVAFNLKNICQYLELEYIEVED